MRMFSCGMRGIAAYTRVFASDTPVLAAIMPGRVGILRYGAAFTRVVAAE